MGLITANNIFFTYGSKDIFTDISFNIDTSWKLGLIGSNGIGKTTLFNILLNKLNYSGSLSIGVEVVYFPFQIKDKSKNTYEVFNDIEEWELLIEMSKIKLNENVLYRPFNTLSYGEQVKVMLCYLFTKENYFYLLDEPTNHLDTNTLNIISNYLNSKKGYILISHNRTFLDKCCDHILYISKTKFEITKGNYSTFYENKLRNENDELLRNKKLNNEIEKLEIASKKASIWANKLEKTKYHTTSSGNKPDRGYIGMKSARLMKKSKNFEKRISKNIEESKSLLTDVTKKVDLLINQVPYFKKELITFDKVSFSYNNVLLINNLSFTLNYQDRLVIQGNNGSGKSTILKLITKEITNYTGNIYIGSNLKISYVSQNDDEVKGDVSSYIEKYNLDKSLFFTLLNKLGFDEVIISLDNLSSGLKRKIMIARSLCTQASVYIWDEALNYIDINSRIQIENLILENKPTMILIEHELYFTDKIKSKVINL